jgi:hypothetical protein
MFRICKRTARRLSLLQAAVIFGSVVIGVSTQAVLSSTPPAAAQGNGLSCIYTPVDFANAFLEAIQEPLTSQNLEAIVAWEQMEGGNWANTAKFNPMNTTLVYDGSQPFEPNAAANNNGYAVQAYNSWGDGLNATVLTIENGYYSSILKALSAGNSALTVANAIDNSVWGTKYVNTDLPPNYDPISPSWEPVCSNVDTTGDAWVSITPTQTTQSPTTGFCRTVGAGPNLVYSYLACTPYSANAFGSTVTSGPADWGFDPGRGWVSIPTGAAYCRRVGAPPNNVSSYLECTTFNGQTFGPTVLSPVVDWGYDTAAQWVSTPTGAAYCRRVGAPPNNVSSHVECTTFNGQTFGPTVLSPVVNWGFNAGATWVGNSSGTEYCAWLDPSHLGCTPFNGQQFGATQMSGVQQWGYDT